MDDNQDCCAEFYSLKGDFFPLAPKSYNESNIKPK